MINLRYAPTRPNRSHMTYILLGACLFVAHFAYITVKVPFCSGESVLCPDQPQPSTCDVLPLQSMSFDYVMGVPYVFLGVPICSDESAQHTDRPQPPASDILPCQGLLCDFVMGLCRVSLGVANVQ